MTQQFDVLIIGSGAAGLTAALKLPDHLRVAVVSKSDLGAGSTKWAQGGIAAVLEEGDTIEDHIRDTLVAGAGLCHEEAVRFTVEHGPEAIRDLIDLGVPFTKGEAPEDGYGYHLTREGGHSHRRVIHVADATGKALQRTLQSRVMTQSNISLFTDHMAVDLITERHMPGPPSVGQRRCYGAYLFNRLTNSVEAFAAKSTILASGGASRVYLYTSNPDGATGDGIALAWRAGCRVANMEFNQFHPTCLYHPEAKTMLLTEALRGEGAHLLLPDGTRFMPGFDERAELAPRDVVARAIDHEMKRLGIPCVHLDISHRDPDFIVSHFPNLYRRLMRFGLDMTEEPIPVVPAAHYTCGGVMVDSRGHTDLQGLYCVGESSHTGLHGANRMASNSLLECIVYAGEAARDIAETINQVNEFGEPNPWDESQVCNSDEEVVVSHNWAELRRFMWDYVGIVRTDKRLQRAKRRVDLLAAEINEYYGNFRVTADLLELRNLVTVADLIIRSAQSRKESRGLHFTTDYPDMLPQAMDTIMDPTASKPAQAAIG